MNVPYKIFPFYLYFEYLSYIYMVLNSFKEPNSVENNIPIIKYIMF